MAVGQQVLTSALDVGAVLAVEARMALREVERSAVHAGLLRDVLDLCRLYGRDGLGLAVRSQVGLVLRCSDHRAGELLTAALVLADLPGALEALECGLLGVEQSRVVVDQLLPLPDRVAVGVWERVQAQLIADEERAVVRPPARLRELLAGWVIIADPEGAVERRRDNACDGEVDYRKRGDGLVDLFAVGLSGPDAHACLSRIRACAAQVGSSDDRPAGRRRVDALVDLILGRRPVPVGNDDENPPAEARPDGGHCGPSCGCLPGSPVPCGAELTVLVPLGAALGVTDELASLVGHGPLEPDLLRNLLSAGPTLRPVWVDPAGVPVAIGDRLERPGRDDQMAVRHALLGLATSRPGPFQPRHPDDHPPDDHPPDDQPPDGQRRPDDPAPAGTPGPYRVPARLRRFLQIRRPLCEWPGCGARAVCCDMDHDVAWPDGPTCACNLGPACRRHHRIKQLGWVKQRTRDAGVRWTSPTGQSWTSPHPHQPPAAPVRALPSLAGSLSPLDELTPSVLDDELFHADPADPRWDDPDGLELSADDIVTRDGDDPLGEAILTSSTRWTLDLDDPYAWMDEAHRLR